MSFTGTSQDVRTLPVAEPTTAQRSTDQYFQGMAFARSGTLVVGAYDRSYGTDETPGFSDISVLTSANLTKFTSSQRVTTTSMPPATEFNGTFFGDYAQLATAGNTAHPVWSDTRAQDLFLCPGTGTPGNPPQVCTGAGSTSAPLTIRTSTPQPSPCPETPARTGRDRRPKGHVGGGHG